MDKPDLLEFLDKRMSMTDVYQPVVIKELLLHGGRRTKAELASALAAYDLSVQEYYERIVMRWPKITLSKHGIIDYECVFRRIRPPIPTTSGHLFRGIRPPVTRCREAACFGYQS
jgi:hypothetical protein